MSLRVPRLTESTYNIQSPQVLCLLQSFVPVCIGLYYCITVRKYPRQAGFIKKQGFFNSLLKTENSRSRGPVGLA